MSGLNACGLSWQPLVAESGECALSQGFRARKWMILSSGWGEQLWDIIWHWLYPEQWQFTLLTSWRGRKGLISKNWRATSPSVGGNEKLSHYSGSECTSGHFLICSTLSRDFFLVLSKGFTVLREKSSAEVAEAAGGVQCLKGCNKWIPFLTALPLELLKASWHWN